MRKDAYRQYDDRKNSLRTRQEREYQDSEADLRDRRRIQAARKRLANRDPYADEYFYNDKYK